MTPLLNKWIRGFSIASAMASMAFAGLAPASILNTKHNLSANSSNTYKAASETQVCIFCHATHNSSTDAPLWNRNPVTTTYTKYTSSTNLSTMAGNANATGSAGKPTGSSLLCLSCHDGTIALGSVLKGVTIPMSGSDKIVAPSRSKLGTDLSGDHPISIDYTSKLAVDSGELLDPRTLPLLAKKMKLEGSTTDSTGAVTGGVLQCSTCHDAHDNSNGKFLVMSNTGSAMCQTCHIKAAWQLSPHKLSTKTWNGVGTNPWLHTSDKTVAANACENCHQPHTAAGKVGLQNAVKEEDNCYPCHNGNVAAKNIQTEFSKVSIHPIASNTGVHNVAETNVVNTRHVECADCHNPHASIADVGPVLSSLVGLKGVDINGSNVSQVTAEYQVCFRCHADSLNKPAAGVTRQIVQTNTRLEFATTNPSFHPIAGAGKSSKVPSLLAPYTTASIIKCEDCHNNNSGTNNGGTGPKGPHGSTNPKLLERPYATGTPTAGDICYKCHSQSKIKAESPHNQEGHLNNGCKACHDPHGVSGTQGSVQFNSRLINLSTTDTTPIGTGANAKLYIDTVNRTCYLNCHGEGHNGRKY